MSSKLSTVKELILEILSTENEYTTEDIKKYISTKGITIDSNSSVIRTAIYQLRSTGLEIYSRDRGIYQLINKNPKENNLLLEDFETIYPNQRFAQKRVYIHPDGKVSMSGSLNSEIKTRLLEIRISKDFKKIALIPNGEHAHKFTKTGVAKNNTFIKIMKNRHRISPVTFNMKKQESSNIWIGQIESTSKNASK